MTYHWLPVLEFLSDGRFHSGEDIAKRLGISRAAVWKHIGCLRSYGIDVHAVKGKGYRLTHPLELLDGKQIESNLPVDARDPLARLDVLFETESTNQVLIDRLEPGGIHGHVCIAEYQSAGRGRRASRWVAPLGRGICMSLGWKFDSPLDSITALSLASGVALMHMLEKFGVRHAGLKWPNDVLCRGRKLAGILTELKGEAAGPCHIVLGVGINVVASESMDSQIDQPWTDLTTVVGHAVSRNAILAVLIAELFAMLSRYKKQGFAGFIDEWRKYDLVRNRLVRLRLPGGDIVGQVRGVDDDGALLLSVNGSVRRYLSGDVSLRPVG